MSIQPSVTCKNCDFRCDDKSLNIYRFEDDVKRSEEVETHILNHINLRGKNQIICRKSKEYDNPDLEISVSSSPEIVRARLEVKLQTRAFMKIASVLPDAGLQAWETVALNLSDLERYIKKYKEEKLPIHLVWQLDRYCLGTRYLYQDIAVLSDILDEYKTDRRYRRNEAKVTLTSSGNTEACW